MKITEITAEKKEKTIQRLAAYCRVSSDSEDQLHSFAAQVCYYTNYEKQNPDVELVGIYADEGLSGTSMKNRGELQRLIQDCQKGKIDRIVTKSVSRLARNTQDLLNTIRLFKSLDVSVYFEEQGIDTLQMNSELFLTFPGMVAQQESESISGNMRWSYKKRMESGEFNCCAPAYGFDLVNGELIINEKEAAVVRRIFDMYLQGMGKQQIANILNSERIPTKNGNMIWRHTAVNYILNNERYMGDAVLQKRYTTETLPYRQVINNGEKTKYYVENANPAIISKDVYETVQNLQSTKHILCVGNKNQLLNQKMFCPKCGRSFRRLDNGRNQYWISIVKSRNECTCYSFKILEKAVFESFVILVYKLKLNRKQVIGELIQQIEQMKDQTSDNQTAIKELDTKIAQLSVQNHVLSKLYNSGIISSAEYTEKATDINNKIYKLRGIRRKKIAENRDDEVIDELNLLNQVIEQTALSPFFDETLFERIVKKVKIINNIKLRFHLIGDIEFTETIDERLRCKQLCAKGQSYTATDIKTV